MGQINTKELSDLALIEITEDEQKTLNKNLTKILGYMESLEVVDTEEVPACNHVLETVLSVFREDTPQDTLDRDTFLNNAPDQISGMVKVPPVLKEE
ncbi:MAG: Glutamyl-tRNA(Gln) amidotransferase subunit C [Chlamydiia bacterium]|nr:Glutamyl-tRNA(Gln) amidotransferase subunit C [Chlamydiia bacterium]MCH9615546.1 Glutamyl-tRNA(Gln) amidotransferase subunit C [Chlamydiia bacterium]MCH9629201.1 Glutamyl-tRNA(Gln) amidotransferase subunit C [Chlamydiia bacterium]